MMYMYTTMCLPDFALQATTFAQVIEADMDSSEDKAITALGILNTMETLLNVMENQAEVKLWTFGCFVQDEKKQQ